ncbi:MAG TPA: hypothetical protein VNZ52_17055, partial [Candidatus Thermoplasmatota archaeon]|nr:hypothetical protein [Candidatus Thermoplasmatota archaeon]
FPATFVRPAPRLLNVLGAGRVLLSHPEAARMAFHDQAWHLMEEARHFLQAVDLGWVRVQLPAPTVAVHAR